MADNTGGNDNFSVSLPVGAVAAGLLVGLAAATYFLAGRGDDVTETVAQKGKAGKGKLRKLGLMTLVSLIENDATRKVVVATLKAMARRS